MQDPHLLDATASEQLTMDDEIKMQQEWRDDETKCTFIILARDLIDSSVVDIPPSPPLNAVTERGNEIGEKNSYPDLVGQTLDAMIGDINLFLSEEELDDENESDDWQKHKQQQTTHQSSNNLLLSQAELDIMIAAPSHRHKNLGTELALMMMHYGASNLGIRRFFVKIKESNASSLKLFKEKLGFVQCAYAECFGEYELECKLESADEMIRWVERRRGGWSCHERDDDDDGAVAGKEKSGDDDVIDNGSSEDDGDDHRRCRRLYDVYNCPL